MKNIVLVLVLVAALGGGYYFWKQKQPGAGTEAASANGRQTVVPALSTNINFAVTVAGEIGPAEQVSVRPEVNGRISELPVDIGDRVKKGDLLFALDDRDLQIELDTRKQEIESAQLQLEKARLRMQQAERDYLRDQQLYQEKLVSEQVFETTKQTWDSVTKDFELAGNAVERARSTLALTEEKLTKTRVRAEFDCTVLTRPISAVGQAVSGSGGFNSGTEVMTIANLADLVIMAHVNQADVIRLRTGMEVRVAIEAVAGLTVTGIVERISPQATIVNNIKGFSARIRLKTPDERVQPGMTANITIPVASAANVVAVPLAAVFTEFNQDKQQNERFIYVREGGKFVKRPARIGVVDYFFAEVQEGVRAGEIVAIEKPAANLIVEPAPAQAAPSTQIAINPGNT
jgi:HlyD family secretion protein